MPPTHYTLPSGKESRPSTKAGWVVSSDPAGYPSGFLRGGTIINHGEQRRKNTPISDVIVQGDDHRATTRLGLSYSGKDVTSKMMKAAFERAQRELNVDLREQPTQAGAVSELAHKYLRQFIDKRRKGQVMVKAATPVNTESIVRKKKKRDRVAAEPVQTSQIDPNALGLVLGQFQQQLSQLQQDISAERAARRRKKKKPVVVKPEPEPEVEFEETVQPKRKPDDMVSKQDVTKLIEQILGSLQIPDLQPKAAKPKHRVAFAIPGAGQVSAFYHWVLIENGGVFLVYDTRFEHGMLYEPPDLGRVAMRIKITSPADASKDAYECTCLSTGVSVQFGCFMLIWLIDAGTKVEPDSDVPAGYDNMELDALLQQGSSDSPVPQRHMLS